MTGQTPYNEGFQRGWQSATVATRLLPEGTDPTSFDAGYRAGWNARVQEMTPSGVERLCEGSSREATK